MSGSMFNVSSSLPQLVNILVTSTVCLLSLSTVNPFLMMALMLPLQGHQVLQILGHCWKHHCPWAIYTPGLAVPEWCPAPATSKLIQQQQQRGFRGSQNLLQVVNMLPREEVELLVQALLERIQSLFINILIPLNLATYLLTICLDLPVKAMSQLTHLLFFHLW